MQRRPCRRCGDPIIVVRNAKTGNWQPLDADPDDEDGCVLVDEIGRAHMFDRDTARILRERGEDLHVPHQANCDPYAAQRRTL